MCGGMFLGPTDSRGLNAAAAQSKEDGSTDQLVAD